MKPLEEKIVTIDLAPFLLEECRMSKEEFLRCIHLNNVIYSIEPIDYNDFTGELTVCMRPPIYN
ncbi:MAG: hypothetical protein K0S32_4378 [Bacteroidetes bacterium]|jgi:hypothetical protein|nr:hypothetical protein [Bacteroidota bacterium]